MLETHFPGNDRNALLLFPFLFSPLLLVPPSRPPSFSFLSPPFLSLLLLPFNQPSLSFILSSPSHQYLQCSPLSFTLFHVLIRSHIAACTIVTRHQLEPGTDQCIVVQYLQNKGDTI